MQSIKLSFSNELAPLLVFGDQIALEKLIVITALKSSSPSFTIFWLDKTLYINGIRTESNLLLFVSLSDDDSFPFRSIDFLFGWRSRELAKRSMLEN